MASGSFTSISAFCVCDIAAAFDREFEILPASRPVPLGVKDDGFLQAIERAVDFDRIDLPAGVEKLFFDRQHPVRVK